MKTLKMEDRNLDYGVITDRMTYWLKHKNFNAKTNGFVVGVSGGVDSAVVSTLAAMTGKALTVLELPIYQRSAEINRAEEHINWLQENFANVTKEIIDLTQIYNEMLKIQPSGTSKENEYLANVNLRSRLRASQIYSVANRNNALVVGTGNKVEDYGIGFFTKYGDGAVDISPIGELYKSEVYKLAENIGVNQHILEARPTDGLHPDGATDEDQIGATYDELEWAMVEYDNGKRNNNYKEDSREKQVMEIYQKRHEQNYHKMEMPPVFEDIF